MPSSRAFVFFSWLSVGLVLRAAATGLEAMGDAAPLAAAGVSVERMLFHGAAVLLTISALLCFGWALIVLFRKRRKVSAELAQVFEQDVPVEVEQTPPTPSPEPRRVQPKGFGRKVS